MEAELGSGARKLIGLLTVAAIAGAILYFALSDAGQRSVTVEAGNPLPDFQRIDREDDLGAGTVRAYLQGALACSGDGRVLMARLSRRGESAAGDAYGALCPDPPGEVTAEVRGDGPVWEVTSAPALRVARNADGEWEIAGPGL